jgi:uncharacterized protein (DUF58 family)
MKLTVWTATLCAVAVFSLAFTVLALAGVRTTSPGQHVKEVVLIEDSGITVGNSGRLPRGVDVTFFVKNLTKTPKNFQILGKQTKSIPPGKQEKLNVTLVRRGVFPYQSSVNPNKKLRGVFDVY